MAGAPSAYGLGQQKIAGFTLHGVSPTWVVLHFKKDGGIDWDDATPYLGKGNFEAQSHAARPLRQEGDHRPLRARSASIRVSSPASPSATRTAAPPASPHAAAWAR